jgi:uncharacterized membrane protein
MNKKARNVQPQKPAFNTAFNPASNAVAQAYPQQQTQIQVAQQVTTIFDPEVLRKYSLMVPDAPERVLAVFEKNSESERNIRDAMAEQQRHMAEIQGRALDFQARDNRRRDWMAYSILFIGIVATIAFTFADKNGAAIGAFVSVIAYAVGGFLYRSYPKKVEQEGS